jgi:hypothetical protein
VLSRPSADSFALSYSLVNHKVIHQFAKNYFVLKKMTANYRPSWRKKVIKIPGFLDTGTGIQLFEPAGNTGFLLLLYA